MRNLAINTILTSSLINELEGADAVAFMPATEEALTDIDGGSGGATATATATVAAAGRPADEGHLCGLGGAGAARDGQELVGRTRARATRWPT